MGTKDKPSEIDKDVEGFELARLEKRLREFCKENNCGIAGVIFLNEGWQTSAGLFNLKISPHVIIALSDLVTQTAAKGFGLKYKGTVEETKGSKT